MYDNVSCRTRYLRTAGVLIISIVVVFLDTARIMAPMRRAIVTINEFYNFTSPPPLFPPALPRCSRVNGALSAAACVWSETDFSGNRRIRYYGQLNRRAYYTEEIKVGATARASAAINIRCNFDASIAMKQLRVARNSRAAYCDDTINRRCARHKFKRQI